MIKFPILNRLSLLPMPQRITKILNIPAVFIFVYLLILRFFLIFPSDNESFFATFVYVVFLSLALMLVFKIRVPQMHSLTIVLLAALTTNLIVEAVHSSPIYKDTWILTFYSNMFLLMFFLPGALELPFCKYYLVAVTFVGEFFGLAQYYSKLFRGTPLRPLDFRSLLSAVEISSDYSLIHPVGLSFIAICIFNWACITRFAFKSGSCKCSKMFKVAIRVFCALVFTLFAMFNSEIVSYCNEYVVSFDLTRSYKHCGYFLGFFVDYKRFSVTKVPPGYNKEEVEAILASFAPKETVDLSKLRKPNIFVILSESFADYTLLANLSLNQDFMPYIRSLKKNTVKGYVSVSAYAGLTCNSEYEFFTGNSMSFYSYGTAAYAGLVNDRQESLTYILNNLGYNTISCCATSRSMWNVGAAYKFLHFNESFFRKQFYDTDDKFKGWPTDRALFEGVKNIYLNRSRDKPLFIFLATMQNHAQYPEIPNPLVYSETHQDFYELSTYLTGLKLTDNAIKNFTEYFSEVDEDVVVVFFGDHYPSVSGFYQDFLGKSRDELPFEKRALTQLTPFFIWANYDIQEEVGNYTLSYLSTKLMDILGFPKTAYMNFLDDTRKHLPVITPFAFVDENGNWQKRSRTQNDYLDRYYKVQYYMINRQRKP